MPLVLLIMITKDKDDNYDAIMKIAAVVTIMLMTMTA